MADDDTKPADDDAPEATPDAAPDDQLGDPGKRALDNERAARKAAEKTARDQAKRIADLEAATQSETERAIAEAKDEGKAEARKDFAPRLVRAEFRAASAGRLDADRLGDLLEDIDLSRFLDEDGEVDAKKVAKKVDAWAPAEPVKPGKPKPDPRQGAGDGTAGKTPGDAGLAEAQRRFAKK